MRWLVAALALLAAHHVGGHAFAQDAVKGLKAKEWELRKAAVLTLAREKDPKAEKALAGAFKDEDWEIVELAAVGLGENGSAISIEPLCNLALDGPVRRIRRVAAESVARIGAEAAVAILVKKVTGDEAVRALQALEIVLRASPRPGALEKLEKTFERSKDESARAAFARARLAGDPEKRGELCARFVTAAHVEVAAAALESCAEHPELAYVAPLAALLAKSVLAPVVERRALLALRAALDLPETQDEARDGTFAIVALLTKSKEPSVAARGVRLVDLLAPVLPEPVPDGHDQVSGPVDRHEPKRLLALLEPALAHADVAVRALAARTLARFPGEDAPAKARELAGNDPNARVRIQALEALVRLKGAIEETTAAFLCARLSDDADARVREGAAVALGKTGNLAAHEALVAALADKEWSVAACAAVSLGKTQSAAAVDPLAQLALASADWKLRGAAVVGLTHVYAKPAIPPLIERLADPDPSVVRAAHAFLSAVARETLPPESSAWKEWWSKNKAGLLLVDPKVEAELKRRFSDSSTAAPEVYRDLDVFVLQSRGDHIERIFDALKIAHQRTSAGKLAASGLQPEGVCVSNCSGEIEAGDVERLQWFVRCGGHLFGSCWALTETIGKAFPGVLEHRATKAEVGDRVVARACAPESPYLEGVFAPDVEPIYALEGAHLITVVEPERAEVLVDSPACAARWGSGDLAAWFSAGHGVVVDSANHFDVQGLAGATELQTGEERMAYAVDHMGLSYAALRASRHEKYWESSQKASEKVLDLSVFRLVTNFVRLKRAQRGG